MITRRRRLLGVLLAPALALGCAQDPITGYDVELVTLSDCTQVGSNAVQCLDEEEAAARTRAGRWIFEDKGGANIVNPLSSFILTTDRGRITTGVHFANDGSITTGTCLGEGGECYFARIRVDSVDEETGCQAIQERSFDLKVIDGALSGQGQEIQLIGFAEVCTVDEAGAETCQLEPLASCGTTTVSQVIVDVNGALVDEPVQAREPTP